MSPGRWVRIGGRVLLVAAAIYTLLAVRAWVAGRQELADGRQAERRGDLDAAVAHYRRAVRWYLPAAPHVVEGIEALARLARQAERANDTERALLAWRSLRGAILSTRSLYTPHEAWVDLADERIAALMASQPPPPIDAGRSADERHTEYLAQLRAARERPTPGWALLAVGGFALFVGAVATLLVRGLDAEDRFVRPVAARCALAALAGLFAFLLGLWLA
ncbi:MAG: hypothetical protein NZ898_15060 [Myxococcota bacterium]|nr:hypothetical protein [Myxococcota bacterium]MDW8363739.1 hypothetical protein [Myxococcales bacterium]